jgi:hypothetical protein
VALEYVIYCDESEENGCYFSNFYGGALVRSADLEQVRLRLEKRKEKLNLLASPRSNDGLQRRGRDAVNARLSPLCAARQMPVAWRTTTTTPEVKFSVPTRCPAASDVG